MIKQLLHPKTALFLAITIAFVVATSCSSEETVGVNSEEGGTVIVTAEVAQQLYSRAYQAEGYVVDGIYNLSYPLAVENNPYNVASVNFNKEGSTPGMGIVTVPDNQELKWENVGGSTPTFYLDNVDAKFADPQSSTQTRIVFSNENPYKAAVFDSIKGANDLLWGEKMVSRGTKTINFDLHHQMSRIRVQVRVDRTNEQNPGDLSLEGATVEISSINQTPIAYNRLSGAFEMDTLGKGKTYEEIYSTLILVKDGVGWVKSPTTESTTQEEADGGSVENTNQDADQENTQIDAYITQDFVLPPQGLLEDENRPKLTIKLKNGREYSGILPHAMEIEDGIHEKPYPVALYFLKEHILSIRTVITEEPPELAFMPVWVVEWVDKGGFTLEAHQSGIYTAAEFYELIKYYQANNEYQLTRYGQLVTDKDTETQRWVFNLFHSIELDYDNIHNKMHPSTNESKNFSFNFNNYTCFVKYKSSSDEDEIKQVGADELYQIVTGQLSLP